MSHRHIGLQEVSLLRSLNLIRSVINQEAHLWEDGTVGVFPRRISQLGKPVPQKDGQFLVVAQI